MAANEVATLATDAMPYVTAAVGAYGGAVLARAHDKATSAGLRILQRVFGHKKEGEPLPEPLAVLAAYPGNPDALDAVRLAIRTALAADAELLAEVRSILAAAHGPIVAQHVKRLWGNVPARNPCFTDREPLLTAIRDALASGDRAVVQALHGMGGVGKTQLAIEYTHRHADDYAVVWWLNSENANLLSEQFASLAAELSCAAADAPLDVMRRAVLMALHDRDRWLLIFDNAEKPEDIAGWLPGGNGHVLVTSRAGNWHDLAVPVEVDVFSRAESIATLRRRVPHLSEEDADKVAEATGDLPLAVAGAADYMARTAMPPAEYIHLLGDRPAEILDLGKPWAYPRSLATVTRLSFNQLRAEDPAAAAVIEICAVLAPEPIPPEWFAKAATALPKRLRRQAADAIAWRQVIARLRGSGLVRVSADALLMHRLTQVIIREHLTPRQAADARDAAVKVLTANHPDIEQLPVNWPVWARVTPHMLALDPAGSDSVNLRKLAIGGTWYLACRGDLRAARDLARQLYDEWRVRLGEDHPDTLFSAKNLAAALGLLGEYEVARGLDEDTLARRRRVLGEDHPDTLVSANNLAVTLASLGEYGMARDLCEDTLARRRRVLGDDHPDTLTSADNLAGALRGLGEYKTAQELGVGVLARSRRVLGEDHPDTLWLANNLAVTLASLGEYAAARGLGEDTLARCRRVLGEDNPETLGTANNLTVALYGLGEYAAARGLGEDTLARCRRVLGEDHPDTRRSAQYLADDLRIPGEE